MENTNQPVNIFYSYSHKDELFRDELETHLKILQRNNIISEWHDRKISPGTNWNEEIDNNLAKSDIILLLISSDFIASDYCWNNELVKSIDMHDSGRAIVIPVILRPADWSDTPFSKIQALPKDVIPISKWEDRDEAWMNVSKEIANIAKSIQEKKSRSINHEHAFQSIKELMTNSIERIDYLFTQDSPVSGITTGFAVLDEITAGLHGSELIIVASRPSVGKTSFALNIAEAAAIKSQCPVAIFSLDMSGEALSMRLMTSLGRVDQHKTRTGKLEDEDWPRLTSSVGILVDAPIYVDDTSELNTKALKERTIKLMNEKGVGLIIVDYLQLISQDGVQSDDKNDFTEIARNLKLIAKDLNVPVLLLSQLGRTLESRVNKRPCLQDLSRWGGVDDVADVVIFVYRDEIYNEDSPDRGLAEIIVAKNRNGPVGTVRLAFLGKYSRFENLAS